MAPKRKRTGEISEIVKQGEGAKPVCKYGTTCYRKSEEHLNKYLHPKDETKTVKKKNKKLSVAPSQSKIEDFIRKEKNDVEAETPSHSVSYDSDLLQEVQEICEDREENATSQLPSSKDVRESIKEKFLVNMPEDFYDFWEFCKSIETDKPECALLAELGLTLVGPYDELCGKFNDFSPKDTSEFLCHWRYYYDPPEFQTVMKCSGKDLFHIGYYRDSPSELPCFVAWNEAGKNCIINPIGPNLFAAVSQQIEMSLKKTSDTSKQNKLENLKSNLEDFAKRKKYTLEKETKEMKSRKKLVVTKTFHKAGIVVKVDKNGVGYRPLPENDAKLQKLFTRIAESKTEEEKKKQSEPLHQLLSFVQFANDECDYGMGLELGLDLFLHGDPTFHKIIQCYLPLSYELLKRPEFGKIIKAHVQNRRRGEDLSIVL